MKLNLSHESFRTGIATGHYTGRFLELLDLQMRVTPFFETNTVDLQACCRSGSVKPPAEPLRECHLPRCTGALLPFCCSSRVRTADGRA